MLVFKKKYLCIEKNVTYDCVICFSLWSVGLRIAIWCETLWGRGQKKPTLQFQHLNPIGVNAKHHFALWTFISFPGLFLWNTYHTVFAILRPVITILYFELAGRRVGLPHRVVWGQSTVPPPVILWIRGTQGWDYLLSIHYLSGSVSSFHCHFLVLKFLFQGIFQNILCSEYKC